MKKLSLKINKGLKAALLVSSLLFSAWAGTTKSANALAFVPFALVANLKKKNYQMSEDEENIMKGIQGEISDFVEERIAGKITEEEAVAKIQSLQLKASNIMIGEGDNAKSVEDVLREQGLDLTNIKNGGLGSSLKKVTIKEFLSKNRDEIEKVFRNKHGFVELNVNKEPAIMTTENTIDFTTNPLPDDVMESFSLGAFAFKRYGRQFIASVADRSTVSDMEKYTVWEEEGDVEGAFAIVEEGALKPLLSADIVKNYAEAQKVAGKYVVTEEFTKFFKRAYQIIQRIIRDKMVRDYESLLRTALFAADVSYTGTTLDGTITDPNDYDAIGAVAAQIEALNFIPDTLILNPQDKWRIRLSKSAADGHYLFPVTTENGVTRMFEFNVVTSTYQTPGQFTLAESNLFKIEEEAMSVRMGYGISFTKDGANVTDVQADLDHNRFRVIVETWFKTYLPTPYVGSIVTASFATVKTALETPQA